MKTAEFVYADADQDIEFTCTLEYTVYPAEPAVGILTHQVVVTAVRSVEGIVWIDGEFAELRMSDDPRTGWEQRIKRRVMRLYADSPTHREAMDEVCWRAENAAELRSESAERQKGETS